MHENLPKERISFKSLVVISVMRDAENVLPMCNLQFEQKLNNL